MARDTANDQREAEFSLLPAGPIYNFFNRALAHAIEPVHRHLLTLISIVWLPLVILTIVTGMAWNGGENSFFKDLDAQARLLVSMPLLILGERILDNLLKAIVAQFHIRELIAPKNRSAHERTLAGVNRIRRSLIVEVLIIALAFGEGFWLWREKVPLHISTWYGNAAGANVLLTAPGLWYAHVSLPIFRVILLRWYFRLVIWYWFLWKTSRIPLQLNALHPDRAGGLGFLTGGIFAFLPMLLAHSIMASAGISMRIRHEGSALPDFSIEIASIVCGLLVIALLPYSFFGFQLAAARRYGLLRYGAQASQYVKDFWHKWTPGQSQPESLLGSSDIQSLADLDGSFAVIRQMRVLPFGKTTVLQLGIVLSLPYIPLIFTLLSAEELIRRSIKLIM